MSDNIVDLIRERTDEQDVNQILKPTMGGYSKKSVLDYLAQLKRQQQNIVHNFNQDMQRILEEKDHLQTEKSTLQAKLTKVEADYRDLQESLITYKLENSDYSLEDVRNLKSTIASQEKDLDEAVTRIRLNEQESEQQKALLQDKDSQIEQARQETRLTQEQLLSERTEMSGLRKQISSMSQSTLELQNEVQFLKKITSDGAVGELNARVSELLSTVDKQQALIDSKNNALAAKSETIDTYTAKSAADRVSIEHLSGTVDALNLQLEKLDASHKALLSRLKKALADNVQLSCEKSDLNVEKAVLARKLESAGLAASLRQIAPHEEAKEAAAAGSGEPGAGS